MPVVADELLGDAIEALLGRSGETILVLVDDRLRIVRAGAGTEGLAERPSDQLTGMSLIAAFGSVALDGIARQAQASGAGGDRRVGARAGWARARSRSRRCRCRAARLVIALHETTSQRRAERIRRDFVANISHELRTPLASIKLLAETLSEGAVDDPQTARDFTLQIEREVDHLAQLVDELLDLSMIESGETKLAIEPVEPRVLVRDVAERIRPVAERRGVTVVAGGDASLDGPRVAADPARLGQALLNLAHNAVKYSHPGGEVRIGWEAGTDLRPLHGGR